MNQRLVIALIALFVSAAAFGQDRFALELEGGPAWQLRNDFAVPGDGGTLVRVEERGPALVARTTLTWQMNDRWSLRFLAAPLSLRSDVVAAAPVTFEDATFGAGETLRVNYRFDSYRVSAIRRFDTGGRWTFRAGATLKLRDAEIGLRGVATEAVKKNRGLVPLLYGGARLQLDERTAIDVDADAAAAPQGRAIDAAFRVERKATDRTWVYLGARMLEGGADNDEVDTFATFAYLVGGLRVTW
ncbi:MAG: hypothetical protein WA208_08305 [Thermoanaerobaculia bacterium]